MLTLEEAQAILAAVGSDTPPTAEQLTAARSVFVKLATEAKEAGEKLAMVTMIDAIKAADLAIAATVALEAEADAELEALAADIPELAAVEAPEVVEVEAAVAPATALTVAEAAERIRALKLGLTPAEVNAPVEVIERAQTLTIDGESANDATMNDLALAFSKSAKSSMKSGRTTIAQFRTEYQHNLTGKADANSRLLDDLSNQAFDSAVIAAGGCCSLAEPLRDQPMLASLARPIASALPTVGASAGAVTMFPPVCLPQSGVNLWTCAQDEAVDPEDPDTWKVCDDVECADPTTVIVDAIYRCLNIGNFQQRFAPERWAAILHAATAQHARLAEIQLFSKILAGGTASTAADTGSIYVTFLQTLIKASAYVRQTQRYDNVRIKAIAPSWLADAIDADRASRAAQKGRTLETTGVRDILAEKDIDIIWSNDINPFTPGSLAFPSTAQIALFADGGVFRLDGGELDLGTEIRDMTNNRQNQVSAFAESFETALIRSCDVQALTLPVTVCDQAPCSSPELVIPGSTPETPVYTSEVSGG